MLKKIGLALLLIVFLVSCTGSFAAGRTVRKVRTQRVEDETLNLKIARNRARSEFSAANKTLCKAKMAYLKEKVKDKTRKEIDSKYKASLRAKVKRDAAKAKLDAAIKTYANALRAAMNK
ncbi:MAG: hypothetical protein KAQ99_03060 [Candidatus Aureabacteria bacterium]|nr:hypothetical protein [Candidatus Auribacterota bacterium]MCK5160534.1 hypothetical protein [Candidatus Auribacterota bacterium]